MKSAHITTSSQETQKIAMNLANQILKMKPRPRSKAFLIGLEGDLGGGKTTFTQGFMRGLGIRKKVLSPTFLIMKRFAIPNSEFSNCYHLDCYRLKKPKEILDLGFKEIIQDPKNIVIIEWAEKIKGLLPLNTVWINFDFINEAKRKITIK